MHISQALLVLLSVSATLVAGRPSADRKDRRAAPVPAAVNMEAPVRRATPSSNECLIFEDDFNNGFDVKTWKHDLTMGGGGNWEFEWYTNNRTNSFVKNGVLYLSPTLTEDSIGAANFLATSGYTMSLWGNDPPSICTGNMWYGCERSSGGGGNVLNPIQSALLRTAESVTLKYGRVEVVAKLPQGDWIWPAIWMLPRYQAYGNWPASGEIDIIESRGNLNYPASLGGGANTVASTMHWGPYAALNRWSQTHGSYTLPSGTFADAFHTFGIEWNASGMTTYVDNTTILTVPFTSGGFWQAGNFPAGTDNPWDGATTGAPFDQEFYLVMNVAVGGTGGYWSDSAPNKPWQDTSSSSVNEFWAAKDSWYASWGSGQNLQAAMAIDSVKIWSGDGQCGSASTTTSTTTTTPHTTTSTTTSSTTTSKSTTTTTTTVKTTTSTTSTTTTATATSTACTGTCSCNGQNYNSAQYFCQNGILCPIGTTLCGSTCIDPSNYICCSGTLKQKGQTC